MRRYCWLVTLLLTLLVTNTAWAQGVEAKLKVAYLANIASFIKWPDAPSEIGFCVSSKTRLLPSLLQLDQYSLGDGKALQLRQNPSSAMQCHMAFSDEYTPDSFSQLVLSAPWVLSITDAPQALVDGHAIQLFVRNLRLRFAINTEVVAEADYKISSKLLRLARQLD